MIPIQNASVPARRPGPRASAAARLAPVIILVLLTGCAGGDELEVAETAQPVATSLGREELACAQELVDLEGSLLAVAGDARAAASCRADADCALVDLSVSCMDVCPTAVPAALAEEARQRAAATGEAACATPRQCAAHPTCPPIKRAACVSGRCVPDLSAWTKPR